MGCINKNEIMGILQGKGKFIMALFYYYKIMLLIHY